MGLDMYLSEKIYLSHFAGLAEDIGYYKEQYDTAEKVLNDVGIKAAIDDGSVTVKATVLYWRKANAIHRWFVEHVQGGEDECREWELSKEQLTSLRDLCQEVLDDHNKAAELLPTQSGFFFGLTEYDKWYFSGLEHTVEGIDRALRLAAKGSCFTYESSW